jgi:phosphatidylinositol alpha-mannosyltransferase
VNRHVQSLAEVFLGRGDEVTVIAPHDPPDRLSHLLHRAPAEPVELPDYLVPVGRTVGIGSNGSVSNIPVFPEALRATRRTIEQGGFDVVHLHEPITPVSGWDTCLSSRTPVVGTFHAYGTRPMPHRIATALGARRVLNRLSARIAVSEAAAWTGRRWFGGNYTVIPNGVDLADAPRGPKPANRDFSLVFIGRPEERKGLPVLLRAFEALIEHVPARLAVIGSEPDEVRRLLADPGTEERMDLLGRVPGDELWRELHAADLLCAPSLAGESFGMVLTEAFAAGTPVIASDIAGYRDVVTDGHDGILVQPGDPQRLAEELLKARHEPARLDRMARAARESSAQYDWPVVADRVKAVYERAIEVPQPADRVARLKRRVGLTASDGLPPAPAVRLPALDATAANRERRSRIRKLALGAVGFLGVALTVLAARKIGVDQVASSIVRSDISWVLVALVLMGFSLFVRAQSWYMIARAAIPNVVLRRRDFVSATMIGVLMSATLPARLGEPARAVALSRHTGDIRGNLPVVIGTLVSQTVFNVIALVLLGLIIVTGTDLFHNSTKALFTLSFIPLLILLAVVALPYLFRRGGESRLARLGQMVHQALTKVRQGLEVFRQPKVGFGAAAFQLAAWGIQLASCWALMVALGLDQKAGIAAAAAVLFAVNVTAVIPATPSNIGIFQLAVISVLTTGWGISASDALAYGVILQAVEITTAVGLGVPALFREGLTWSDMKAQAMATSPVDLGPAARERGSTVEQLP